MEQYEGVISKVIFNKGSFYIIALKSKNKNVNIKGKIPKDLRVKAKKGNIVKIKGEIKWNEKYANHEMEILNNNIDILESDKKDLEKKLETLEGEVSKIIYRSEGFNVFKLKTKKNSHSCTSNASVFLGTRMKLKGYFNHNKYGLSFKVVESEELPFSNQESLITFLSSDFFKGIGEHFATKIVDKFGLNTIETLIDNPQKLKEVEGIGDKRSENIMKSFNEKIKIKEIIKFAVKYDITQNLIFKLYEKYGKELINLLQKNPYIITEIRGIGFKKADKIANKIGIPKNSNYRINSFIKYYLSYKSDGHTYFRLAELAKITAEELEIEDAFDKILEAYFNFENIKYSIEVDDVIINKELTKDFILYKKDDLNSINRFEIEKIKNEEIIVSTIDNFNKEIEIYEKLNAINRIKTSSSLKDKEIKEIINTQEEKQGFDYAKQQKIILENCLKHELIILTGKAGTGKSTITKGMVELFAKDEKSVLNLAPTGKAAKRVIEVTGKDAHTIHKAVYSEEINIGAYDVIMVDEAGMLSTYVGHMLIRNLNSNQILIMIGDVAQIPPVQSGNIFRDIINMINTDFISGYFVELDKIQRQDEDSYLATICNSIADGHCSPKINYDDIVFYKCPNKKIVEDTLKIVNHELEKGTSFSDLQVISPQYRGKAGINVINTAIQERFNKNEVLFDKFGYKIKRNDKVMQTLNVKELGIVNGDTLKVLDFKEKYPKGDFLESDKKEKFVICELDNGLEHRIIDYPLDDFRSNTTLAYCCSAHKMQGSEYPVVIYILSTSHYIMLNRNLLYTGLTRGKEKVYLLGQNKAFYMALNNEVNQSRNTVLDLLNKSKKKQTIESAQKKLI